MTAQTANLSSKTPKVDKSKSLEQEQYNSNSNGFSARFNEFLDRAGLPERRRPKILAERLNLTYAAARKWTALDFSPRKARLAEIVNIYRKEGWPSEDALNRWLLMGGENPFGFRKHSKFEDPSEVFTSDSVCLTHVYLVLNEAARQVNADLNQLPFNAINNLIGLLTKEASQRIDQKPSLEVTVALLQNIMMLEKAN